MKQFLAPLIVEVYELLEDICTAQYMYILYTTNVELLTLYLLVKLQYLGISFCLRLCYCIKCSGIKSLKLCYGFEYTVLVDFQ